MNARCIPRRRTRNQNGSASLELVVVFPVLLLCFFAVVQGALYFHARNVAMAAAQQGARAAASQQGSEGAGVAAATTFVVQAGGPDVMTQIHVYTNRTPTAASVTVIGRSLSVLPGVAGLSVSQTADRPVERFTTPENQGLRR